jgi:uncharacterized protein YkwD
LGPVFQKIKTEGMHVLDGLTDQVRTFGQNATLRFDGFDASNLLGQKVQEITATSASLPGPLSRENSGSVNTTAGALSIGGIITWTNTNRAKEATLPALVENTQLDASAKVKAEDILKRQYFEHTAPDGTTVSDLVAHAGYTYVLIGENLALGDFVSDKDVVDAWMASPGHRANILNTHYTEIGIGIAYGMYEGHTVYVAVQHFGLPRIACPLISESLKASVEQGQRELDAMNAQLAALKQTVEQGRARGDAMNDEAEQFNALRAKYELRFGELDALRQEYNSQVSKFNTCLTSVTGH